MTPLATSPENPGSNLKGTTMSATQLRPVTSSDPLLQPIAIRNVQLKNRILSTSHAPNLADAGMPGERYQRYHEEKAKGGIALTMFGGSSNVSADSADIFGQLNVGSDRIIPHFRQFADRLHRHGAALMCQVTHLGRRSDSSKGSWLPAIAPSPIRETLFRNIPRQMDRYDIERVVADFGNAARRCREGGLDGVEVFVSGHLIGQFLSPYTNKREDEFGGSLENRCRFGLMVLAEVRRQVGTDYVVGLRFTIDEAIAGGLSFDDSVAIARVFDHAGYHDFFNVFYGTIDTAVSIATNHIPGLGSPLAPWLSRAGAFKTHVAKPVFHAARIADLATARYAIGEGLLDMVGMTRAHLADPHLVSKMMTGQEDRIRPCVGASHCRQHTPVCIHNPSSGRETTLPHQVEKAASVKRAVVVGGGPAGLEAARVLAERGHAVVLYEAGARLGGQVLLAAKEGWRKDLIGIIDWRVSELQHLGVEVRLNAYVEADDIASLMPEVVVVATGGRPNLDGLDGGEHCLSTWDALSNPVPNPGKLVVFDGTGRMPAALSAERYSLQGHEVAFVTLDNQFGQEMGKTDQTLSRKGAYERRYDIHYDLQFHSVSRSANRLVAAFRNELTGAIVKLDADHVIVERGTLPEGELFDALRNRATNKGVIDLQAYTAGAVQPDQASAKVGFELYRVGDAVTSRDIHSAIYDSARLCRNI